MNRSDRAGSATASGMVGLVGPGPDTTATTTATTTEDPGDGRDARQPRGSRYVASHVTKAFNGAEVLHDVSIVLEPGSVHSLLGENGAGKSTLFKIMSGLYEPDAGELVLGDERLHGLTPRSALQQGIYLVPQEPTLMAHLSAAENLYVGALPRHGRTRLVDWKRIGRESVSYFTRVGLDIDIETPARNLSIAQQQLLECARALVHNCQVILFDEPTSPLTPHEVDVLFELVDGLRSDGLALGFISHRLDEVISISDQVTVLRDGRFVMNAPRGGYTRDELVTAMIGRPIGVRTRVRRSSDVTDRREILRVEDLAAPPTFTDISFTLRKHEVTGLAGLVGSGRTEIAEAIFGLRKADRGKVVLDGVPLTHRTPRECIDAGLIYLPEDRARNGIFGEVDIGRNVTAGIIPHLPRRWHLIRTDRETLLAAGATARTAVHMQALGSSINTLSGGNQQRAMISRWLLAEPKVAIFDEPTRGVDVGAKDDIYDIVADLATSGLACLVISSDLEELTLICDRVLVIYEGRIVGEVEGDDVTTARLGQLVVEGAM